MIVEGIKTLARRGKTKKKIRHRTGLTEMSWRKRDALNWVERESLKGEITCEL